MKPRAPRDASRRFEAALARGAKQRYVLRLYVAGGTAHSMRALENLKRICDEHLHGRYTLEVIDVYQRPEMARGEQILAVPTLIRRLPTPLRKIVGDLSGEQRVLVGLDVTPTPRPHGDKAKPEGEP
jgi:circadian clock protein KaiB